MLGHQVEQRQRQDENDPKRQEAPADLETDRSQHQFARNADESPSSASSSQNLAPKIHDSNSSDDDDDDDDDEDDDENIAVLNIPPGVSIMDHLSMMPNLSQADRLRVLSRVDVEAKRKEVAVYVGEKAAGEMQELEVVQKFNQLDNWKFSLINFPFTITPRFILDAQKAKEKERKDEERRTEEEEKRKKEDERKRRGEEYGKDKVEKDGKVEV